MRFALIGLSFFALVVSNFSLPVRAEVRVVAPSSRSPLSCPLDSSAPSSVPRRDRAFVPPRTMWEAVCEDQRMLDGLQREGYAYNCEMRVNGRTASFLLIKQRRACKRFTTARARVP